MLVLLFFVLLFFVILLFFVYLFVVLLALPLLQLRQATGRRDYFKSLEGLCQGAIIHPRDVGHKAFALAAPRVELDRLQPTATLYSPVTEAEEVFHRIGICVNLDPALDAVDTGNLADHQ